VKKMQASSGSDFGSAGFCLCARPAFSSQQARGPWNVFRGAKVSWLKTLFAKTNSISPLFSIAGTATSNTIKFQRSHS